MIRPVSVASLGFISNSNKSLSIATDGMLISTSIPINIVTPNHVYSVDHNLRKNNILKERIKNEDEEILLILKFISERIL